MHIFADGIKETTSTTGTGNYTLDGAAQAFFAFSTVMSTGDTCTVYVTDGIDREVGEYTYNSSGELERTTILASTNSNNAVNWGTGTKSIALTHSVQDMKDLTMTPYIPASAMYSATTNGAGSGSVETSSSATMLITKDFDASTDEYVQFYFRPPAKWLTSTFTAQIEWSHAATTTNFDVVFAVQAKAVRNDSALDGSWGTAVTISDTGGTTDDLYITPVSSAITPANSPVPGDMLIVRIYRDVSEDALAVDARLHGITLNFNA